MLSRDDWIADPRREDYPNDSAAWETILANAYDTFPQPHELFGALWIARCYGARLLADDKGNRKLFQPLEHPTEYAQAREVFLKYADHMKKIVAVDQRVRS